MLPAIFDVSGWYYACFAPLLTTSLVENWKGGRGAGSSAPWQTHWHPPEISIGHVQLHGQKTGGEKDGKRCGGMLKCLLCMTRNGALKGPTDHWDLCLLCFSLPCYNSSNQHSCDCRRHFQQTVVLSYAGPLYVDATENYATLACKRRIAVLLHLFPAFR